MPTLRQLIKSADEEKKRYIIHNNNDTYFKKLIKKLHLSTDTLANKNRIDINGQECGKPHIWLMPFSWYACTEYTELNATDVQLLILKKETNE